MRPSFWISAGLLLAGEAAARLGSSFAQLKPPPAPSVDDLYGSSALAKRQSPIKSAFFDQLIDHNNPSLGTFKQKFWWNAEFYGGPGSPIVLNAPGEGPAGGSTGYTTNRTLEGVFGQTNDGAVILLEHRYWGESSPFENLTTTNLQYLTLDNAIQDLIYFANNVELEFAPKNATHPSEAPWILSGCSYPGALTAWVNALAPGTFWAYHCSSAVVETIGDFWQYNVPIEEAMPKNCTKDMRKVIKHIDTVLTNGTIEAQQALKDKFGLGALKHNDDFGQAIIGGLQEWQGTQFYSRDGKPNPLFEMCDYIENQFPGSNKTVPGPEGVGLCKALNGFAKWSKEILVPGACEDYGYWKDNNTLACYEMHNKDNPIFNDYRVDNPDPVNRQWNWMLCNEPFEWWQVSSPDDTTGLVTKFLDLDYWHQSCANFFPKEGDNTYGIAKGLTYEDVNRKTGGWNYVNTTRLMWVNGENDPWKPATVSADDRPGGPLQSTEQAPVWVIPKAAHCNDLIIENSKHNAELKKIVDAEIAQMKKWVDEFYTEKGKTRPGH